MNNLTDQIKPVLNKIKLNLIDEAFDDLRELVKKSPENYLAYNLLGQLEMQKKEYDVAIEYFNKGLEIKNNHIDLMFNKACSLNILNQFTESEKLFEEIVKINSNFAEVFYNLALVKKKLLKTDEAIYNFNKSINLKKDFYQAYYNLGNCNKGLRNFKEAIKNYEKCLEINPVFKKAILNLGIVFFDLQNFEKANFYFDQIIKHDPNNSEALYNKSLNLLKHGKFEEGFSLYEQRWKLDSEIFIPFSTKIKKYDNKTKDNLFVWFEQGLGDEIMFSSVLNELSNYPAKITALCSERLKPLFKRSFQHVNFISSLKEISSEIYDSQISIGSLFKFFKKNIADFDGKKFLNAKDFDEVSKKVSNIKTNKKPIIGISWYSSNKDYGNKSIELKDIFSSIDCNRYNFINLQYGNFAEDIDFIKKKYGVVLNTLTDNFGDIDKLASIISLCDQVISIDNLTVQLSGALGVPTKVLLKFPNDWRWLAGDKKSYWYNSLTILEQESYNNWAPVLKNLSIEMKNNG